MKNMKFKLLIFIIPFVLICFIGNSQNIECNNFKKAEFKGDFTKYLARKLVYSHEALLSGKKGQLIVSFGINELGKIDSINVDTFPHYTIAENAVKILLSTKDMWTPTVCDGINIRYTYKIVVDYLMQSSNGSISTSDKTKFLKKSKSKLKKSDFEKALKYINMAIKHDEYDYELYLIRSSVFKGMNEIEKCKTDILTAEKYKKEILSLGLCVVGYGYLN
jgi:hypothetical protein